MMALYAIYVEIMVDRTNIIHMINFCVTTIRYIMYNVQDYIIAFFMITMFAQLNVRVDILLT
jgi:hypothetical protein